MPKIEKDSLSRTLSELEKEIYPGAVVLRKGESIKQGTREVLLDSAVRVLEELSQTPYETASYVARAARCDKYETAVAYKMIQRSRDMQEYLKNSGNRDYFNVVNNYFNNRLYTLVFFVGTTCPSRCVFCPNVKIDENGRRTLLKYGKKGASTISEDEIHGIFKDLEKLTQEGSQVLVKVSGGLEPLTDPVTLSSIISMAETCGIYLKLFTNGMLLRDPYKRSMVLGANDIRISLSTDDARLYQDICFGDSGRKGGDRALPELKKNIEKLVMEKRKTRSRCKIGFNTIVMEANHERLIPFLDMAKALGVDYVDFKPDYFSSCSEDAASRMEDSVLNAKMQVGTGKYDGMHVNFTDSISRKNFYWNAWSGLCDTESQAEYKMFITPYGQCSPVHYGAFPHGDGSLAEKSGYSIGRIQNDWGLLDVRASPEKTPGISMKHLNPFELMLSLEYQREKEDEKWGIPLTCSPYHTSYRNDIPPNLFSAFR